MAKADKLTGTLQDHEWLNEEVSRVAWRRMVAEKQLLADGLLTGEVMRTIRLAKPFPLLPLKEVWDSERQQVVRGDGVKAVVAREAAKRHPPPKTEIAPGDIARCRPPRIMEVPCDERTVVEQARAQAAQRHSRGAVAHGVGHRYGVVETIELLQAITSNAVTMDGYAGKLQRSLGLRGVLHVASMLSQGYGCLPPELPEAIHFPLKKPGKKGCDINKISRPVLEESAAPRTMQRGQWRRTQPQLSGAPPLPACCSERLQRQPPAATALHRHVAACGAGAPDATVGPVQRVWPDQPRRHDAGG